MSRGSLSSRLVVAAVLVVAALAVADSIRGGSSASPAPRSHGVLKVSENRPLPPNGQKAIERIGTAWARHLASNGLSDCFHTGEELCGQLHCIDVGGQKRASCRMPTAAYRRSFRGADVVDVLVKDWEAVAMLSNGEPIELHADEGTWWVLQLGRGAGRGFFEKPG